jgi:hypothetical protein
MSGGLGGVMAKGGQEDAQNASNEARRAEEHCAMIVTRQETGENALQGCL